MQDKLLKKIDNNIGFYDQKSGIEIETEKAMQVIQNERNRAFSEEIKAAQHKLDTLPQTLSLREITILKRVKNKPIKNKLLYERGSFYIAMKQHKNLLKGVSLETIGAMHLISEITNKSGIVCYENKKPIKYMNDIRLYFDIYKDKWSKISKEIELYNLIREFRDLKDNNKKYIIVNPLFSHISTEISEIRFLAFGDIIKKNIDFLDYIHLCILYDINP